MSIEIAILLLDVVRVAWWVSIFGGGIYLYRRLRLRSMPWLLAYCAVGLVMGPIVGWVAKAVVDGDYSPWYRWTVGDFVAIMGFSRSILATVGSFIIAGLIVSEVVCLVGNSSLREQVTLLKYADEVRQRVGLFGGVLIGSQMVVPAVWVVLWFLR